MKLERNALLGLLVIAITIRVAVLVIWGPLYQPDSYSFKGYAQILMDTSSWVSDAELDQGPREKSTFRMIGYPLLMGGLMNLFGENFDYALAAIQSAASIFATYLAFRLARAFGLNVWASFFCGFAYTSSILFFFDMNILVDSLFANGLFVSMAMLVLGISRSSSPPPLLLFASGALMAATLLIRETAVYFAPFVALGAVIWAKHVGKSWAKAGVCYLLVLLPVLVTATCYREWNRYRTDRAFLTTGAQMTMWFGPMEVARRHGVEIFSYDPRVQVALTIALKADPNIPMDGAKVLNRYLFDNEKMQAPEIAQMAFGAFFHAARAAPVTLLSSRLKRVRPRFLMFNVSQSVESIIELATDVRIPGFRDNFFSLVRGEGSLSAAIRVALDITQRIVSVFLLFSFLGGAPYLILRRVLVRRVPELSLQLLGWFWIVYFAINAAYVLASFEDRYVMATMPLACIGGVWILSQRFRSLRAETNVSYSRI